MLKKTWPLALAAPLGLAAPAWAAGTGSSTAPAGTPESAEELRDLIRTQQQTLEGLERRLQELQSGLEATAEAVEAGGTGHGADPSRTHVGGYGELHYSSLDNQLSGGDDLNEIDFHRFVLYFGHDFSDRIRFASELEVEHSAAGDGSPGAVEMEQAFLEFDLGADYVARAGIFLVPTGILNETHEPNTFYGVERNPVETRIIPTTWAEGGGTLSGRTANGFSWDLAVGSGLEVSASRNYAIRKGRQKVAEAVADDLAYTARLRYSGVPGLTLSATVQRQSDVTQGTDPAAGAATLIESNVVWNRGPFGLRALYARWDLDGTGPAAVGADVQRGWYVEPSWKPDPRIGFFARYNRWDNQAGDRADSEYTQVNVGLNYWPHPDVVLKLDLQDQSAPAGSDEYDGINLGVGYQF